MYDIKQQLINLPYWGHLSDTQKEFLLNNATIRHFDKDNIIHGCSEACLGMAYVLSGCIRVYLLSTEGKEVTLFRMEKNDPSVLSASCVINEITFDTQMVAEKDSDLLVINAAAFKKLNEENIYVKCFTYELMTRRFSDVVFTMQQILFEKLDKRIASFLLSEYRKNGTTEIKMTHEAIAKSINSAREVVERMLKRFEADNFVELKRGIIVLKDIEALETI